MDRAEVGRRGEAVAARFYQKQGCLLVAHNYSLLVGEIDLILREPDGTLAKQRRILRTAQLYLQHTNQSDQPMRFDVAEVTPLDSGRWMVHIIKGAFTA